MPTGPRSLQMRRRGESTTTHQPHSALIARAATAATSSSFGTNRGNPTWLGTSRGGPSSMTSPQGHGVAPVARPESCAPALWSVFRARDGGMSGRFDGSSNMQAISSQRLVPSSPSQRAARHCERSARALRVPRMRRRRGYSPGASSCGASSCGASSRGASCVSAFALELARRAVPLGCGARRRGAGPVEAPNEAPRPTHGQRGAVAAAFAAAQRSGRGALGGPEARLASRQRSGLAPRGEAAQPVGFAPRHGPTQPVALCPTARANAADRALPYAMVRRNRSGFAPARWQPGARSGGGRGTGAGQCNRSGFAPRGAEPAAKPFVSAEVLP